MGVRNVKLVELAAELGMTIDEVFTLCELLGVPVRSHESSLNEAYADMIRRRAVRDGLTRETSPVLDPRTTASRVTGRETTSSASSDRPVAKVRRIRVYELAAALGVSNTELLGLCETLGVPVSSHLSLVNEAYAAVLMRRAVWDGLAETMPQDLPFRSVEDRPSSALTTAELRPQTRSNSATEASNTDWLNADRDARNRRKFDLYPKILDAASIGDEGEVQALLEEFASVASGSRLKAVRQQAARRLLRSGKNPGVLTPTEPESASSRWLEGGKRYLQPALWSETRLSEPLALLQHGDREWAPDGYLSKRPGEDWLDEILARASSLSSYQRLAPSWPAAFVEGDHEIIVWVIKDRLFGWFAVRGRGVVASVDIRSWDAHYRIDDNMSEIAAGLALSWFLDCSLVDVSKHPHFAMGSVGQFNLGVVATPSSRFLNSIDRQRRRQWTPPKAHRVRGHIRRLPVDYSPTESARGQAPPYVRRRMGPNDTFVRAHGRGGEARTQALWHHLKFNSNLADALGAISLA
jgi:hypothetical protein